MMKVLSGDIFESDAITLVNPTNCQGVMGKGLALKFKEMYPDMASEYAHMCAQGKINIGDLWLYEHDGEGPEQVLCFPTKNYWKYPSSIAYIETGLVEFTRTYATLGIVSVAFPALGCGEGKLDFDNQVLPLMHMLLRPLNIDIEIYLPVPKKGGK